MAKRITANQAGMIYSTQYQKDVFQQKEASKMNQVIKLTKILVQRNGLPFAKAAQVAKRAYRMGIRCNA